MREESFKLFLIGLEKINAEVISLIDLQGNLDREYAVGFFFGNKPSRSSLKSRWPENDISSPLTPSATAEQTDQHRVSSSVSIAPPSSRVSAVIPLPPRSGPS
ncbi:uncharacterized protein N7498_001790 [Penicillium cinerascens]|uniref:Uncharacterized protein n=1 Tax=Penicillium cinerascens TaxID=70096 RepID=A0A9W9N8S1_9EURO|nr:uncharacterized protein N7498_001790 [Penicillium cinerascens]KAJ5215383.1 hypothetical protein N7498_001790 [Penicillium cinerascens]